MKILFNKIPHHMSSQWKVNLKLHKEKLFVFFFIIISFTPFYFLNKNKIYYLTREDGFFEYVGAIFLFISSLLSFYHWYRDKRGNNFYLIKIRKNIFYLLLGLLFLVAAGEEISWGQRIFKFSTPSYVEEVNIQKEFNIHNIKIFEKNDSFLNHLFFLLFAPAYFFRNFIFVFCFLIPLIFQRHIKCRKFFYTINIPISKMDVFYFFCVTYLISRLTGFLIDDERLLHSIVEVKEFVYGFFMTYMMVTIKQNDESVKNKFRSLKNT